MKPEIPADDPRIIWIPTPINGRFIDVAFHQTKKGLKPVRMLKDETPTPR